MHYGDIQVIDGFAGESTCKTLREEVCVEISEKHLSHLRHGLVFGANILFRRMNEDI